MAKKIRLTRTMVTEYAPDPTWYPDADTIEEMAQIDVENFNEDADRELMFSDCISDTVKWEIVEDSRIGGCEL